MRRKMDPLFLFFSLVSFIAFAVAAAVTATVFLK